jgi:hypothetical protein
MAAHFHFLWVDSVFEKLTLRGLSTEDVEVVVSAPISEDVSWSTGLPVAFGYAPDGRYVMVVYEQIDFMTIQVITAYEVPEPTR